MARKAEVEALKAALEDAQAKNADLTKRLRDERRDNRAYLNKLQDLRDWLRSPPDVAELQQRILDLHEENERMRQSVMESRDAAMIDTWHRHYSEVQKENEVLREELERLRKASQAPSGRPQKYDRDTMRKMRTEGHSVREIMDATGASRRTVMYALADVQ